MPCYRPVPAFFGARLPSGKRAIVFTRAKCESFIDLKLPCGSCVGCRLERARQWAMRCMDEAQMHADNSFITLTFDEAHLPSNRSLDMSVFQKFMKRFRKEVAPLRIRFFTAANMVLSLVARIIIRLFLVIVSRIVSFLRKPILVRRFIHLSSLLVCGLSVIRRSETFRSVLLPMSPVTTSRRWVPLSRIITMLTDGRVSVSSLSMFR